MASYYRLLRQLIIGALLFGIAPAQTPPHAAHSAARAHAGGIDTSGLMDSAHHWRDITDEDHVISPLPNQPGFPATAITDIADNMLRYQKTNGGWPKNYDMQAVLTDNQKALLMKAAGAVNTTFDNGATHSHIRYLAEAWALTGNARYSAAALRGIDFILSSQYANGGWPQFYPVKKGYARYITFNDGAMIGVMNVLHGIVRNDTAYAFVDTARRTKVQKAFEKGIDCILKCQIEEHGTLTAWCQQHDDVTLRPQKARTFEPACISNMESADIVEFLMSIDRPSQRIISAVRMATQWFESVRLSSIRVETIASAPVKYQYHTATTDKIVIADPTAPPIWPRFTELGTHRPLFSNRNWKIVYSLAEVDRERRTGYGWYTDVPEKIVKAFPAWEKKIMSATSGQKK